MNNRNTILTTTLYFFLILIFIFVKLKFETHYFDYAPMHDTLWSYNYFQYFYNFYEKFGYFPEWIADNSGGLPSYGIINFSGSFLTMPMTIIGNFLQLNSYLWKKIFFLDQSIRLIFL